MEAVKATSQEKITAGEMVRKDVEVVNKDASVADAVRIMCERNLRQLAVVDETRSPLGVISLCDILRGCGDRAAAGEDFAKITRAALVSQVMSEAPATVRAEASLRRVVDVLKVLECVPVVNRRGEFVGMIEAADAVNFLVAGGGPKKEGTFEYFQPGKTAVRRRNRPAYIRRSTGMLVLPVDSLEGDANQWSCARLGYDALSGRIAVKMLSEFQSGQGALKIKHARLHDGHYIALDANDFVDHFKIAFEGRAYNVSGKGDEYMLTPRN